MLNKPLKQFFLSFFLLSNTFIQCSPGLEEKINAGIKLYREGKKNKATSLLTNNIIMWSSKKHDIEASVSSNDTMLYFQKDDKLSIVYPITIDTNILKSYSILSYDSEMDRVVLCDGINVIILDKNGLQISKFSLSPDIKNKIKSAILIKDSLLYYREGKLFLFDLFTENRRQLLKKRFSPPYSRAYFVVDFYKVANSLAIIAGFAGSYYLSVIDINNYTVLLKNLRVSSRKFFFDGSYIYYISGLSGKWRLTKFSMKNKKKNQLIKFDDLVDIEFYSRGILYENKNGIWHSEYNKKKIELTRFNIELAGKCYDDIILKFNKKLYLVDMNKFYSKIILLEKTIPDFFKNN